MNTDQTLTTAALTRRLTSLERSNRRWRHTALGAVLLAVCLPWTLGFQSVAAERQDPEQEAARAAADDGVSEVLRARSIVLVDVEGRERIVLDCDDGGNKARLRMRDTQGQERLELGVGNLTAHLAVRDPQEHNRIGLAVDAHPHLMLQDVHQKPRLHMAVGVTNAPSLLFFDAQGRYPSGMGLTAAGEPWLLPQVVPEAEPFDPTPPSAREGADDDQDRGAAGDERRGDGGNREDG